MNASLKKQIDVIRDMIVDIVPVERIYLFGSYAYGQPHENSDLDLYVVVPDDSGRDIDIAIHIKKAIRTKETSPVDILVSSSSRFQERMVAPTLERQIVERGELIYG
jgi:predicted nucleotidyltransferase